MDKEEMRKLYVQAAESLMILQDNTKIKKKAYLEIDALVGRLLKAAIETLEDEPVDKVSVDVVGWPKIDTL